MDEMTVKTATISSILFLILIIIVFEFSPAFPKQIQAKELETTERAEEKTEPELPVMEMDLEDNLQIPLPKTVLQDQITVIPDLFHKMVNIGFQIHEENFDVSKVVNTAKQVSQLTYQSERSQIEIRVSLNDYYETKWCCMDGCLYLRFFKLGETKPLVLLDAGHGGFDVGANKNGIFEKDMTLSVCEKLKAIAASREDVQFCFTRENDTYLAVEERAALANDLNPDLFVSVHINWYDDAAIHGTSVLYNSLKGTEKGSSYWLASILNAEVEKTLSIGTRGVELGDSIYVVRYTNVPAALVELGFMTNDRDLQQLLSEEGQEKAAQGLYSGIEKALKELGKIQ